MRDRFYEDPTGFFRDVDVPIDPASERQMAAREASEINAILLPHKARGAITESDVPKWTRWLGMNRAVAEEALSDLQDNDQLADRANAMDRDVIAFANRFDSYMGVADEDRVREYDEDAALPESERMYRALARLTNEHLFS